MPFEVDIPKLGESVNEVTVLEWLCADGDYVDKDEPICVLETDKANVDLPAPTSGVLRQLRKVDETLSVAVFLQSHAQQNVPAGQKQTFLTGVPLAIRPFDQTS